MSGDLLGAALLGQIGQRGQRQDPRAAMAARLLVPQAPVAPIYNGNGVWAHALAQGLNAITGHLVSADIDRRADERDQRGFDRLQALEDKRAQEASEWAQRLRGGGGAAPSPSPSPSPSPGGGGIRTGATVPVPPELDDADILTRTLLGEAANQGEEGMRAVAATVRNRMRQTGAGVRDVVLAPSQYEPWDSRREELLRIPTNSPQYAAARRIAEEALAGNMQDPTGGATHFLNPDLQRQLGRPQPAWAPEGQGRRIGAHVFYAPGGGIRTGAAGGADPNVVPTAAGGGSGDAIPAQAQAGGVNMDALAEGLASPNPRVRAQAEAAARMMQLQQRQETQYRFENIGGTLYAIDPRNPNNRTPLGPAGSGNQPPQIERDQARYIELDARRDRLTPAEQVELEAVAARVFGRDNIQVGPSGTAVLPAPRPSQRDFAPSGAPQIPATQAPQAASEAPSLASPANDAMAGAAPAPTQRQPQTIRLPGGRTAQYLPAEQPAAPQPNTIAGGMLENVNGLRQVDRALELATQRPQSFGFWMGAANAVPGVNVVDRVDPGGVEARALASNIGSLIIHQRSGAAVTAAEFPRLRPFIPQVGDPPDVVQRKLNEFRREFASILRDQYEAFGPASGYRPLAPVEEALRAPGGGGGGGGSAGATRPGIIMYDAQGRRVRQ